MWKFHTAVNYWRSRQPLWACWAHKSPHYGRILQQFPSYNGVPLRYSISHSSRREEGGSFGRLNHNHQRSVSVPRKRAWCTKLCASKGAKTPALAVCKLQNSCKFIFTIHNTFIALPACTTSCCLHKHAAHKHGLNWRESQLILQADGTL